MNYKNYFILFIYLFFLSSCVKELDITQFSDEYGEFKQEFRIEALMLPADNTAIIRIDKTIAIDNNTLFDCEDDNGNWVGSGCICDSKTDDEQCPSNELECSSIGGLWLITPLGYGYCDLSVILEESSCSSENFDLEWSIIDDLGEDGQVGDPTDEDEDLDLDEPSIGEGNGSPDCGEPNVDDLEEITELSGEIHEENCNVVQIIYNNNDICNFIYSETAGTIYEGNSIYQSGFDFYDGTDCQQGDIIYDASELDSLYYDYAGWIPNDDCPEDFFSHYNEGTYSLYIECDDKIIVSKEPESIPYPIIFVDESNLNMNDVGSCTEEANVYECLLNNNFDIDNIEFTLGEDNVLNYISTENAYQAIQYFDPYYSCFYNTSNTTPDWTYLHGHPAVSYPPSEETNHFPPGSSPIIFTNEEVVLSNTEEEIGCYQYKIYTFSQGYYNYYFASRLDLKDPVRSNLREENSEEVIIGGFGAMSGETITFKVTD